MYTRVPVRNVSCMLQILPLLCTVPSLRIFAGRMPRVGVSEKGTTSFFQVTLKRFAPMPSLFAEPDEMLEIVDTGLSRKSVENGHTSCARARCFEAVLGLQCIERPNPMYTPIRLSQAHPLSPVCRDCPLPRTAVLASGDF